MNLYQADKNEKSKTAQPNNKAMVGMSNTRSAKNFKLFKNASGAPITFTGVDASPTDQSTKTMSNLINSSRYSASSTLMSPLTTTNQSN
jgi:hypothetical protein